MTDKANLKERIRSGENLLGVSVPVDPDRGHLEDILGKDTYDFVSIDSQHSALSDERLVEFCNMAAEMDVYVQCRVKHTRHSYLVGNYVDLGPTGIEVPQVEEEATVDEAFNYFYYPQKGKRSWGGFPRRGIGERPGRHEYADWWNDYGVLWMQIESVNAVINAKRLAKPGVDCLSTGPNDLMYSVEGTPNSPFDSVEEGVARLLKELEGTQTRLCHRNFTPETRQQFRDMGVTVLLEQPKT